LKKKLQNEKALNLLSKMRKKIFGRFGTKSSKKKNWNTFEVTLEEILVADNNNSNNLDLSHVFLQALESLRDLV